MTGDLSLVFGPGALACTVSCVLVYPYLVLVLFCLVATAGLELRINLILQIRDLKYPPT